MLALVLMLLSGCNLSSQAAPAPTAGGALTVVPKVVGAFDRITDTDYLVAPIEADTEQERSSFSFNLSSGSGYNAPGIYNYVFVNRLDETVQQLIPTNDFVILQQTGFPERWGTVGERDFPPLAWFLYSVVKADTNGDKELARGDRFTLVVADVGGRGYTELIDDVEAVLGATLRDPRTLVVIYRAKGGIQLARLDLPGRRVLATTPLPSFGPDVR
jgi:hypothetical protein